MKHQSWKNTWNDWKHGSWNSWSRTWTRISRWIRWGAGVLVVLGASHASPLLSHPDRAVRAAEPLQEIHAQAPAPATGERALGECAPEKFNVHGQIPPRHQESSFEAASRRDLPAGMPPSPREARRKPHFDQLSLLLVPPRQVGLHGQVHPNTTV